jgi:adenosylcobinamide-phosphate synthase
MKLEYQILAAVALDLALGDPRWLPHPVRGIGRLAAWLESLVRGAGKRGQSPFLRSTLRVVSAKGDSPLFPGRLAGLAVAMSVYLIAGGAAWGVLWLAGLAGSIYADVASIAIIYTTIAPHDLVRHSMAVAHALAAGDLVEARRRVAGIVGRDTENLDEAGIVRAGVESVAESTVDGVTAPLFWALVAGPVGAMVYRAVNTLDSMFGHQDDRYARFGWAAARIDDLANYIPARLTAPLLCLAALALGRRPLQAAAILRRDGRKHASPNAGLAEAAMAGALGVQLGGCNFYGGVPVQQPAVGDPLSPLAPRHIPAANALMATAAGLFLAAGIALRLLSLHLWHVWRAAA